MRPTARWCKLRDLATGQVRALTANWDRSVGSIAWAKDGKSILVDRRGHAGKRRCSGSMSPPAGSPG